MTDIRQLLSSDILAPIEEADETLAQEPAFLVLALAHDGESKVVAGAKLYLEPHLEDAEDEDFVEKAGASTIAAYHLYTHVDNAIKHAIQTALEVRRIIDEEEDGPDLILPGEKP